MQDPVVLLESEVTYERQNITTWMTEDESKTCPVSQKKIRSVTLIENASLKAAIVNWQREQSRNPEADLNSTHYPESEDVESVRSPSEIQSCLDTWDGQASTYPDVDHMNPLHAVPMTLGGFSGRSSMVPVVCLFCLCLFSPSVQSQHHREGSDGLSAGSSSTSRVQRQIMTRVCLVQLSHHWMMCACA